MAIPPNGNFRIRALSVVKEIDGNDLVLGARGLAVKEEPFEEVGGASGSGRDALLGMCSHRAGFVLRAKPLRATAPADTIQLRTDTMARYSAFK